MAIALPSYARSILASASETPKPKVDRMEMERGPAVQRLVNPRVLFNAQVQFLFESQQDATDFVIWYTTTLGVIGWFTMRHPRTGATITARFPDGEIGDITPVVSAYAIATVTATIEYYQS